MELHNNIDCGEISKIMKKLFSDNLHILILVSIAFLVLAILDWAFYQELPYGFFIFLRWIMTICSAWIGYRIFIKTPKSKALVLFGILTILFNPFVPIILEREAWTLIDVIILVILLVYLVKDYKTRPKKEDVPL